MSSFRTFRTAIRALRRNVMRAVLTCLGIVIGIGAVIAMMEIGQGSSAMMQKTVASMGAATMMIWPGQAFSGGVSAGAGSSVSLKPEDVDAILRDAPSVKAAAPIVRGRAQLLYQGRNYYAQSLQGSSAAFMEVRDWLPMAEGAPFTDGDVRSANAVCLVGATVVRELFEGQSPVGKDMRIGNVTFKILGVLSKKGANMMGQDQDDTVVAPWTTIKYRVAGGQSSGGGGGGGGGGSSSGSSGSGSSGSSGSANSLNSLYPTSVTKLY